MNISPIQNNSQIRPNFKAVTATNFAKEVILPKQSKKFKETLKACIAELKDTKDWDLSISGYGERAGSYLNDSDLFMAVSHKERFESPSLFQSYIFGLNSFRRRKGNKIYLSGMWNGMPEATKNPVDPVTNLTLVYRVQDTAENFGRILLFYDKLILKCQHSKMDEQERQLLLRELSLKHRQAYIKALEKADAVLLDGYAVNRYKQMKGILDKF